jgi:hypothetical protein
MSHRTKRITLALGAGAFLFVVSAPGVRAEETIIEKRVEESHSYNVEPAPAPPAVVERRTTVEAVPPVVTERTTVERVPPAVIEKRTTVETVPAAPVIERRTTETIHTDD